MALARKDLKTEAFARWLIELQSIIDNSLVNGDYEENGDFIVIDTSLTICLTRCISKD